MIDGEYRVGGWRRAFLIACVCAMRFKGWLERFCHVEHASRFSSQPKPSLIPGSRSITPLPSLKRNSIHSTPGTRRLSPMASLSGIQGRTRRSSIDGLCTCTSSSLAMACLPPHLVVSSGHFFLSIPFTSRGAVVAGLQAAMQAAGDNDDTPSQKASLFYNDEQTESSTVT